MLELDAVKPFLCLILLSATGAAAPQSAFQLGVNYSEWVNFPPAEEQLATDRFGAVYFFGDTMHSNLASSTATKLSPDGKTLVWQNQLGFAASGMTVDPDGGVYVVSFIQQSDTTAYVARLSGTGSGLAWKTSVGFLPQSQPAIAADSQGRVYLAAQYSNVNGRNPSTYVVRVSASGTAIDFRTQVMGAPTSIAIGPSGTAYTAGYAYDSQGGEISFLASIASDGTPGYYTVFPAGFSQTVAVDANENVAFLSAGVVRRIDATGAATVKTTVANASSLALDAAGNAYVAAVSNQLYPVKNSIATCGFDPATTLTTNSELLNVIAPDGTILQATYIPGGVNVNSLYPQLQVAVTPGGTVLVVSTARPGFMPTQTGPFPAGTTDSILLSNLSLSASNSPAPTYALACAGNSASFAVGPISPGGLVTLFGNGLGPQQGVQASVAPPNLYPTQMANAQVTFDGTPAPLLFVQDAQINLVAPWSLTAGQNTQVCVSYNNANTNCLTLPVVQTTPAVFMADSQYAVAINQDGTYNSASNPAAVGSIVTVFATGLGAIMPAQPDGSLVGYPLPTNTLTFAVEAIVRIAPGVPGIEIDVPIEVQYAGPAPAQIAGISQINFRIAPHTPYDRISVYTGLILSPEFSIHVAGQ